MTNQYSRPTYNR